MSHTQTGPRFSIPSHYGISSHHLPISSRQDSNTLQPTHPPTLGPPKPDLMTDCPVTSTPQNSALSWSAGPS